MGGDEVGEVSRGKTRGQLFPGQGAGLVLSGEATRGGSALSFSHRHFSNEAFTWEQGRLLLGARQAQSGLSMKPWTSPSHHGSSTSLFKTWGTWAHDFPTLSSCHSFKDTEYKYAALAGIAHCIWEIFGHWAMRLW